MLAQSNPDFDDYADMARANRVAFCESGSGELCTPLTTCNGNPFHESCGAYFAPAKKSPIARYGQMQVAIVQPLYPIQTRRLGRKVLQQN